MTIRFGAQAPEDEVEVEGITRLTRDLRNAAASMSVNEARFLVDAFYIMQEGRIRSNAQVKAMGSEPHEVLVWLGTQNEFLEAQIKAALDKFSMASPVGRWARSQKGVGPVIAAGLLAHIDVEKANTAGKVWSFAGLVGAKWEKGQKRPWNAQLKTLVCFKLGESFVKVSNHEDAFYGQLYKKRKELETERNLSGMLIEEAHRALREKRYDTKTDAWAWYNGCFHPLDAEKILKSEPANRLALTKSLKGAPGSGVQMLPPAHIHRRAVRVAVKIFLSHYQEVAYRHRFGEAPPAPYVFSHMGHGDYMPPPGWPLIEKAA